MSVHPIEVESYRILAGRVDLSHLQPGQRAVVERMVHASADVEYAETARFDDGAVEAAVAALRSGAPLVTDVEMVRAGVPGSVCYLPDGPERTALYRKMTELVLNYTPWLLGVNVYANVIAQPWLKGYKQNPFFRHQWKYYDVARP